MKDLVRGGIPPELRGKIWVILSGSKEKQSYEKPNYYQHVNSNSCFYYFLS